jgi:hypothetical protein
MRSDAVEFRTRVDHGTLLNATRRVITGLKDLTNVIHGAVWLGAKSFNERLIYLAAIDIESKNELDIVNGIATDVGIHETDLIVGIFIVVLYAFYERLGTASNANDGNANLRHI